MISENRLKADLLAHCIGLLILSVLLITNDQILIYYFNKAINATSKWDNEYEVNIINKNDWENWTGVMVGCFGIITALFGCFITIKSNQKKFMCNFKLLMAIASLNLLCALASMVKTIYFDFIELLKNEYIRDKLSKSYDRIQILLIATNIWYVFVLNRNN